MAILNNLIVNGAARFLNGIRTNAIHTNLIDAHDGVFKTITTTTLDAETVTTDMLKANNARVSQTLTVDGTISTNKWEAANIANIGGNFYISPTGKSDSGNITVTKTSTTTINGVSVGVYTLVVSGTFGVTSTSSTIWGTNSKVIFTGSISYPKMTGTDLATTGKKYPLGTCDGTMSAVSTGTNTLTGFTITGVNSPALDIFFKEMGVTSISSTACSGYEMQISVYQSYYSSAQHPIGILLTSYGKEKKQYIDIYGGANAVSDSASGFAEPSVRVGQLDGLSDIRDGVTDANSPTKPSGWGIYTSNGFFKGKVVANAGIIGGWNIGTDTNKSLYTGTFNSSGGIYISPSYSGTLTVGGNTSKNWAFTAGDAFGVTTAGVLYASSAHIQGVLTAGADSTIGPWTVTETSIYKGNATYGTSGTGNMYFGNSGLSISNAFTVSNTGVLNATNAVLKGLTIKDSNDKKRLDVDATNGINIYNSSEALTSRFNGSSIAFYDGSGTADANKIFAINVTNNGVETQIGKTSGKYTTITNNGMEIKDGANDISLAKFGNAARIGRHRIANSMVIYLGEDSGGNSNVINIGRWKDNQGSWSNYLSCIHDTAANDHDYVIIGQAENTFPGMGDHSCSIGTFSSNTGATGSVSVAEGQNSLASGYAAHAEGSYTVASGNYSHAQNECTIAAAQSQTAIGVYNIEDASANPAVFRDTTRYGHYPFIIGNGTGDNARSNALTVDWNGNVNIASGAKYKINGTNLAASDVGAVPTSRTVNGKALSSNISLTASDVGAVPTSRTVNGKALSSNISLTASDVGAVPTNGNSTTCSYPAGFASRTTGATWGNTIGTSFTSWNDSTGGSIDFRQDNPSSGKVSLKVNGRFYFNEGNTPTAGLTSTNGYWGLTDPDGNTNTNTWIRTTQAGLIPYQSGGRGSGHCFLGTDSWYFQHGYIDNVHGVTLDFSGTATIGGVTTINNSLYSDILYTGSGVVNGNLSVGGTLYQSSDRRLKKHLNYLGKDAITFIQNLKPAHYIKDEKEYVGFYAQDVDKIDYWGTMTEINEDNYYSLNYSEIIAPLVTYCHYLEERIKKLEER